MSDLVKVRCYRIAHTDKAIRVSKIPKDRNPSPEDFVWIPKSICEHISTNGSDGGWPELVISLPERIADQKGLL